MTVQILEELPWILFVVPDFCTRVDYQLMYIMDNVVVVEKSVSKYLICEDTNFFFFNVRYREQEQKLFLESWGRGFNVMGQRN